MMIDIVDRFTISLVGYYLDTIRILGRILSGYYPDTIRILSGYYPDTFGYLVGYYPDTIRILSGYLGGYYPDTGLYMESLTTWNCTFSLLLITRYIKSLTTSEIFGTSSEHLRNIFRNVYYSLVVYLVAREFTRPCITRPSLPH